MKSEICKLAANCPALIAFKSAFTGAEGLYPCASANRKAPNNPQCHLRYLRDLRFGALIVDGFCIDPSSEV